MDNTEISKEELESILSKHRGNDIFKQKLNQIKSQEELLRGVGRYAHFNSIFGAGVANLAGEIAAQFGLFKDPNEKLGIIADRSYIVAMEIFSAAIDEYGDRTTNTRIPHRSLAQATLEVFGNCLGYKDDNLNEIISINEATTSAVAKISEIYCLNQKIDGRKIFQAIGCHIASELLADREFIILDNFLCKNYQGLVKHLENTEVKIGGVMHPAYHWIRIHTTVEADHFETALIGANKALFYYNGPESKATIKGYILKGFKEFAKVQTEFMKGFMK